MTKNCGTNIPWLWLFKFVESKGWAMSAVEASKRPVMRSDQGWFWAWPVFRNQKTKRKKQVDLIFMAVDWK
jgi:hypothetical protein